MGDTSRAPRCGDAGGPSLTALPDQSLATVFTELPTWKDALRLSLACKDLSVAGVPHLTRHVCCAACFHRLLPARAAAEANAGSRSFSFRLDDGEAMCLGEPDDLLPGALDLRPEGPAASRRLLRELLCFAPSAAELGLRVRDAHCGGCDLYLGAQITEIRGLRAGADLDITSWRLGLVLGQIFLALKYLAVLRPDGVEETTLPSITWQDRAPRKLFRCAMPAAAAGADGEQSAAAEGRCGLLIFEDRAVLSKDHAWKAIEPPAAPATPGDGSAPAAPPPEPEGPALEPAWYLNHVDACLLEEAPEEMDLAQGRMAVARVWCPRCQRLLGWRFKACLAGGRNAHHCGRFGVLEGRVAEAPLPPGRRRSAAAAAAVRHRLLSASGSPPN